MKRSPRKFATTTTGRGMIPILFGIAAPSSGGKTLSAIRLATGIERRLGAKAPEDFRKRIHFVDTESRRALQYRRDDANPNGYEFTHLELGAPYSPLDYLDAIEQCVDAGANTVIVDSMTHEHEGEGGVLEMHTQERERIARSWFKRKLKPGQEPEEWMLEKANFSAWGEPKGQRRRLIAALTTRWSVNFILCFRARRKSRPATDEDKDRGVIDLGFMPMGASEYLFEMSARALLPTNADGVPVWESKEPGERVVFKLPNFYKRIFLPPHQLCEEDGEKLAEWSMGGAATMPKGPPSFSARLQWEGLGDWGGKPLADAPGDVLRAYAGAVEAAMGAAKPRQAATMKAHLDDVQAAASTKTAAPSAPDDDPRTADEIAQGYELDPNTNEIIPPVGAES